MIKISMLIPGMCGCTFRYVKEYSLNFAFTAYAYDKIALNYANNYIFSFITYKFSTYQFEN